MSTGQSNYLDTQTRLIEALRNTVEGASWGEFFSVYHKMILSIAGEKGLSPEDSQEVAQEAIIKAHKNIKMYDPARGTFRNWLGVITKSCVIDCFRKQGRRLPAVWIIAGIIVCQNTRMKQNRCRNRGDYADI